MRLFVPLFMALVASSVVAWKFTPGTVTEGILCGLAIGAVSTLAWHLITGER
jgi:hypothetical protein